MGLVAIVGGAGAMGSYFAEIFASEGYQVMLVDIAEEKGRALASDRGYQFMHPNEFEHFGGSLDILLFSVLPIDETYGLIERFVHKVNRNGLLTDVTSVKINPVEHMLAHSREDVAVVGMHPMFRPDLSMEGQRVILTPARDNSNNWQQKLENIITKYGGIIKIPTLEEHDYKMAIIQGMTHAVSMISLGTLNKLGVDLNELMNYSSPVYRMFFDLMIRTTSGQARLYSDIQLQNPKMREIFKIFDEAFSMHRGIVEGGKRDSFEELYNTLKKFGSGYVKEAEKHIAQLVGTPRGIELFFQENAAGEIGKYLNGLRTNPYNGWGILTATIDPGSLTKLQKIFPLASYTARKDRNGLPSHVAFYVRNFNHPSDPEKMIRFSPVATVSPEREPLRDPDYHRVQMINFYSDPILNLFDTVTRRDNLDKLPPFIVYRVKK